MTENINSERKERTYLITRQLCEKIHYAEGTINNWVSAGKLVEGVHFIKPNGKKPALDMGGDGGMDSPEIPRAERQQWQAARYPDAIGDARKS